MTAIMRHFLRKLHGRNSITVSFEDRNEIIAS